MLSKLTYLKHGPSYRWRKQPPLTLPDAEIIQAASDADITQASFQVQRCGVGPIHLHTEDADPVLFPEDAAILSLDLQPLCRILSSQGSPAFPDSYIIQDPSQLSPDHQSQTTATFIDPGIQAEVTGDPASPHGVNDAEQVLAASTAGGSRESLHPWQQPNPSIKVLQNQDLLHLTASPGPACTLLI